MRALGIGPGSLVWTTPNTFVATANTALHCGAEIDFVDIDPKSYCLSADALEAKLEAVNARGAKGPDLVVPVHFAGQSCDMPRLHALGQRFGFRLLEDASHAIGARTEDGPVGDCRFSDATVFSFHPVKIITTGEGGAVTTRDPDLALQMAEMRSHGLTRDPARMERTPDGPWAYELREAGFNYRLTDLQAALGLSQLDRLEAFVDRRHALAARYDEMLAALPVKTPWQNPAGRSSYHLYPLMLDTAAIGKSRRAIFEALRADGIGVNVHYMPVHLQPVYRARGFKPGDCPEAEAYYASALTIPLFGVMTGAEQDSVIEALKRALNA
jgi:UDP-4-amino-4,6-dideoxy-N-acetyl-beta-L-altrosamine transaminase